MWLERVRIRRKSEVDVKIIIKYYNEMLIKVYTLVALIFYRSGKQFL
jgi:hypothetical protein